MKGKKKVIIGIIAAVVVVGIVVAVVLGMRRGNQTKQLMSAMQQSQTR